MRKMEPGPLHEFLREQHYDNLSTTSEGVTVGTASMLFTSAIVVGIDRFGYDGRYCYETPEEALDAVTTWDGIGDPPGRWIVYKGIGGERIGPGAY